MGLLESILKRQVRRIVNNAIDEAVDNTVGVALRDAFGQKVHRIFLKVPIRLWQKDVAVQVVKKY